jgi:hypothetical protein
LHFPYQCLSTKISFQLNLYCFLSLVRSICVRYKLVERLTTSAQAGPFPGSKRRAMRHSGLTWVKYSTPSSYPTPQSSCKSVKCATVSMKPCNVSSRLLVTFALVEEGALPHARIQPGGSTFCRLHAKNSLSFTNIVLLLVIRT